MVNETKHMTRSKTVNTYFLWVHSILLCKNPNQHCSEEGEGKCEMW